MTRISMIVAHDMNRAIGRGGDQLVYISEDLRHFKETTMGCAVVMGRRTNEALPKRRLGGRRNIVITRDMGFSVEGVEVAHSVEEALGMVEGEEEVFVIGGAQVYGEFLGMADRLYVTEIEARFEGADTYFPEYDGWEVVEEGEWRRDEKTGLRFRYRVLELPKRC